MAHHPTHDWERHTVLQVMGASDHTAGWVLPRTAATVAWALTVGTAA